MAFQFTFSRRFQKRFMALTTQEKKLLSKKLELLAQNPTHPSLRTKRIQGTDALYESSINMDIRIVWHYEDAIIVLADVGHHDIFKQF